MSEGGPRSRVLPAALVVVVLILVAVGVQQKYTFGDPPAPAPVPVPVPVPAPVAPAPVAVPAPQVAWNIATRTAKTPNPSGKIPELVTARTSLRAVVEANARDPENPWAVSHAMLVKGSDFELTNGKMSVDYLFAEYADEVDLGGEKLVEFPESRAVPGQAEDIRIEPHTDLLLKSLAKTGEKPDRAVEVDGVSHPMGDLYRASLYRTWIAENGLWTTSWNDTPWAVIGLAAWAPDDLAWTAEGNHPMTMDALTSASAAQLHAELAFVRDLQEKGLPVEKTQTKQGVHKYTCGGMHLLHGVGYAVARGFGTEEDAKTLQADIESTLYRYDGETKQLDALMKTPGRKPQEVSILLTQRLKFSGHTVEVMNELAAMGVFVPTEEQQSVMNRAAADIAVTTAVMEKLGIFESLPKMKGGPNHQLYLDIIGDSAHAARGLDLAIGEGTVTY